MDLQPGDKIDLRALHAMFRSSGESDAILTPGTGGQFYFNSVSQELKFDTDGNGVVDAAIGIHGSTIAQELLILI